MTYKTISGSISAEFSEKRSKFIASVSYADTEDSALEFISNIKNKNKDARHNVYAYNLVNGIYKSSDDGEPQGTAGPPILEIIKSQGLYNCVIVVTRYFGGILLGTGGLVRAYSQAAKLAISKAKITKISQYQEISICCDYKNYNKIRAFINSKNGVEHQSEFSEKVNMKFYIPIDLVSDFKSNLDKFGLRPENLILLGKKYLQK